MAGPWRVRTRKPKGNARVNFAHPLARNIAFFYFEPTGGAAGTFYDAVTGRRHGTAAGITQSSNGLSFNGSVSSQGTAFANPSGADTTQLTVIARVRPTVKPASRALFAAFGSSGSTRGAIVAVDSNGFIGGGGFGSGGEVVQYDATDHTNQWVTVGGSGDGSTSPNGKAWVNGVSIGINFGGGSFTGQAIAEVSLGRQNSGYFQFLTGDLEYVIGLTRILSDAEHLAIARNPWQLLQPANDFGLFSLPAAGAGGNPTFSIAGTGTTGQISASLIAMAGVGALNPKAASLFTVPGVGTVTTLSASLYGMAGAVTTAFTSVSIFGIAGTGNFSPIPLGSAAFAITGAGAFNPRSATSFSITGIGTFSPVPPATAVAFTMTGLATVTFIGRSSGWTPVTPITSIWTPQASAITPWTPQ